MVWLLREHGDDHDSEETLRIDFATTGSRFDLPERAKNLAVTARILSSVK